MLLVIGLDIDGVVADSFPVFCRELNKHYGKDIARIDNYDMTKVYDASWQEISAFFERNVEYLFSKPEPMPGAVETIHSWLAAGDQIVFVTARKPGLEEEVTLKWLDNNCIPHENICFCAGATKTLAVREYKIDIFVEDFMSNALEIAALNVPVLLLDAPYNQGKLPSGVTRCYNWQEIKCQVDKYKTQSS